MQRSRAVFITGLIYALIGLVLAGGGIWLAALGGSIFYIVLGVGILATGALLLAQRRSALWLFAIVLVGTLAWAVSEVQFDWWPLASRGDIVVPMALWLLTPVIVRGLLRDEPVSYRSATLPLWIGVAASSVVLVIALLSGYHDINGTIAASGPSVQQSEADPQPDADWRAYGRTQFGQRYSPLKQITPDNDRQAPGRLDLPHRRRADAGGFRRDHLRGHADQGARHALSLLTAPGAVCARRQDRQGTLAIRSQAGVQQDVPAHDLPRGLLPRSRGGCRRQQRQLPRPPNAPGASSCPSTTAA